LFADPGSVVGLRVRPRGTTADRVPVCQSTSGAHRWRTWPSRAVPIRDLRQAGAAYGPL